MTMRRRIVQARLKLAQLRSQFASGEGRLGSYCTILANWWNPVRPFWWNDLLVSCPCRLTGNIVAVAHFISPRDGWDLYWAVAGKLGHMTRLSEIVPQWEGMDAIPWPFLLPRASRRDFEKLGFVVEG